MVFRLMLVCLLLVCTAPSASAAGPGDARVFHLFFENDLFGGTDRHYTNAVKLTWMSRDLTSYRKDPRLPGWSLAVIDRIPLIHDPGALHNVGLSVGQNIYTPADTETDELVDSDRPYAAFLYGAIALHSKNERVLDTVEISLGIVGPSAQGELAQNGIHDLRDIPEANGWDHQLHDEPALLMTWQRNWRVYRSPITSRIAFDFIPHLGLSLGNVAVYTNVGAELRLGYRLPYDFGTARIRPGGTVSAPVSSQDPQVTGDFSVHVFCGTDWRLVGHNIFLDGNTWRSSHSVDKKYLVGDIAVGAAVSYKRVTLTYTQVLRTKEFDGQENEQLFGSLSLALAF